MIEAARRLISVGRFLLERFGIPQCTVRFETPVKIGPIQIDPLPEIQASGTVVYPILLSFGLPLRIIVEWW